MVFIKIFIKRDQYRSIVLDEVNPNRWFIHIFPKSVDDETFICRETIILSETRPTEEDLESCKKNYILNRKDQIINDIIEYDSSSEVNRFYVNGMEIWLDKDTRVGLVNSTKAEMECGLTETTVWLNGYPLTVNCSEALAMLYQLEVYAKQSYCLTELHKHRIKGMESLDDIELYDYHAGYPEPLYFNLIVNTNNL